MSKDDTKSKNVALEAINALRSKFSLKEAILLLIGIVIVLGGYTLLYVVLTSIK